MSEYCLLVFWLPMSPSTVHRYFDSLYVWVRCFLITAHPVPPGNSGNSGILGIVVRNAFAVRQNHFHGLGNYWEVIFTQSYYLAPPWEFREFGNSGNCCAKYLCCKAKSLPRAWELLGSDIYSFVLPCSPLGIPGIVEFWEFLCEIALLQGKIISTGFGIIGKWYLHKANLCTSV